MPHASRPLVLVLAAALAGLGPLVTDAPPANAGGPTIRPGDSLGGFCTLNFVFDGPGGEVYFGTAAHCVALNDPGSTPGVGTWGVTVFDDDAQTDFALLRVHDAWKHRVVGEVRGHPGLPTGTTTAAETNVGDVLLLSGHGLGFEATAPTRERRVGVLVSDTSSRFTADAMLVWGDSGGPILHADTGKALGTVSAFNFFGIPPTTDVGPTLEGILARLDASGFPVTLRTA